MDGEGRLSLFAVGDDDQAIYGFRDASVTYIKEFQNDYQAGTSHLVENYRSTAPSDIAIFSRTGMDHAPLSLATRKGVTGLWQGNTLLCRLASEGATHWPPLIPTIQSLSVAAMVRRSREDVTAPSFAEYLKCDAWEIPICEAVFQAPDQGE